MAFLLSQSETAELARRFDLAGCGTVYWVHDVAAVSPHGFLVQQAFHWGEAFFHWGHDDSLQVAYPLCLNQKLVAGVVVAFADPEERLVEIRRAAEQIEQVLLESNWINRALMRERAREAARERQRAEAIHSAKAESLSELRRLYEKHEPELFLAMRRGDRQASRRSLNQVLLAIYSLGNGELERIKAFLIELVAMMGHSLRECCLDATDPLLQPHLVLQQLQQIDNDESLSEWVRTHLEGLIDSVANVSLQDRDLRMQLVLRYMRENGDQALTRDDMARRAGLSPSHFSECFRATTGKSFGDYLRQLRMDKARRLLRHSNLSVLAIALECGFSDPSYFTKAFRRTTGQTPRAFRQQTRSSLRSE